mgnify:CR=1 FL=1
MTNQQPQKTPESELKAKDKPESLLLNLLCNIILPTLILTKLSGDDYLGIKLAIVVALAFPLSYGFYDFFARGKLNFFSALGLVSVGLTGGISLLEMDAIYIAIKEASIPGILGIATLLSLKTSQPLIHTLLLNDSILEIKKINTALQANGRAAEFDKLLINAPFPCKIVSLNGDIEDNPDLVNDDAYADGWCVIVQPHEFDPDQFLDEHEYIEYLNEV